MKATLITALAGTALVAAAPTNVTPRASKVKYAGVNMAGFDFGCTTDGSCALTGTNKPYNFISGGTGIAQMNHFVKDDTLNAFRLPVGWQFLLNNQLGGKLDSNNAGQYDTLVQGCLNSGAQLCILDLHNYARWNGQIIGQGGPDDAKLADVWTQLAKKYGSHSQIAFGVMNEPHDIPDIGRWATTVQAAVTAIRQAGAKNNMILLPGQGYTSAETFVSSGSAAALNKVKNPDGSTTNLIMDVHKYLDSDNSGTHTECVKDSVDTAFKPLADWLRQNKRQAFLSETGGGNTASCQKFLCSELKFLNSNSDVYLGYTAWAAGGFDGSYELTETPTQSGGQWKDTSIVSSCVVGAWKGQ
ncbi:glycoside hydrolase family 5 protein [Bipolaris oryzae ATCC 44560]|uniref:Endoglucanase EG-II n=1 Tax=Bipolaris oryzae ATCC 44560 TaxID=930090 RepID=W6Z0U9_COCMI|nr:glycoside hydrolase family 5 protein [Bipolaris oryzae ATCC 44560]EUC43585.1 glycoside hydrolase family 5 protein [Bipolaris oryzae ATCC 44560]